MNSEQKRRVAVIGGGAGGLCAAIRAAEEGEARLAATDIRGEDFDRQVVLRQRASDRQGARVRYAIGIGMPAVRGNRQVLDLVGRGGIAHPRNRQLVAGVLVLRLVDDACSVVCEAILAVAIEKRINASQRVAPSSQRDQANVRRQ